MNYNSSYIYVHDVTKLKLVVVWQTSWNFDDFLFQRIWLDVWLESLTQRWHFCLKFTRNFAKLRKFGYNSLNFRRYNVYHAKLWNITRPWWWNSTESKWNSTGYFPKKNYISPWSTIWSMPKTFSIWFNSFQRFISCYFMISMKYSSELLRKISK